MTSLTYPLQVVDGKLVTTSSYPEIVRQAILSAIMTKQEERIFHPDDYGTEEILFSTVLPQTILNINQAITNGIIDLPDVLFDTYGHIDDLGVLTVTVVYSVEEITDSLEIVLEYIRN